MIVEELVSVLGLQVDPSALANLEKFKAAVMGGLNGMAVAAGAVAVGFAAMIHSTAEAADKAGDTAERLGIASTALQELVFAGKLSDATFEDVANGLKFISKNAVEAAKGSKEAAEAFAGVDLRNAEGGLKTADELLMTVADRFTEIKDPIAQTNFALKVFGRGGLALVPMLRRGSAGIAELRKEAHALGVVFDEETIKAADELDRNMKRLTSSLEGMRNKLAAPLIPLVAAAFEWLAERLPVIIKFFEKMGRAIKDAFERFGKVLAIVGKVLAKIFAPVIDVADKVLRFIAEATDFASLFEAALIGLGVVVTALAVAQLPALIATVWGLVAAAAPLILVALAIGLIVDELANFIEGNDTVLGDLIRWASFFDPNGNPVIEFFKSAIALLFDFTDPKKWEILGTTISNLFSYLGNKLVELFVNVGGRIAAALVSALDSVPLLKDLLKSGTFKSMISQDSALSVDQSQFVPFKGGAAGPSVAPSGAPSRGGGIQQSNVININGTGLNEEQVTGAVKKAMQTQNQEALAHVSGG